MAKVIENLDGGRRKILLSTYDVVSIVRNYQYITKGKTHYEEILEILRENDFYLPEDF